MRLRRAGLLGAAVTFARSERGQRLIAQARERVATPENREKAQQALRNLRAKRSGPGPSTGGK